MKHSLKALEFTDVCVFFSLLLLVMIPSSYGLSPEEPEVKTTPVKDEVWPKVRAQMIIKAKPLESVALFAAYDYQKNYIPNLKESWVIKEEVSQSENDTHVKYKLDMPWPLSDSQYIHGHRLSQEGKNQYKVAWYMIESDSAEKVNGFALFEPYPKNNEWTLVTYESQVTPKSFFAGIFKDLMVKDVLASLKAIKNTTEQLRQKNPKTLEKYSDKINKVLGGKAAYLN